jgi:DNA-binding Lrp family transcriptional regulator
MQDDKAFLRETDAMRSLRILEEIEKDSRVSQRHLANSLGVAVGVANACVHTLVRKGMIKIRGDNNRSISYHLTKKGVGYKTVLALEWTKNTLAFYREARADLARRLSVLPPAGIRRIVLIGSSELVEIATLVAEEAGTTVVAIVRPAGSYLGEQIGAARVLPVDRLAGVSADALVVLGSVDQADVTAARDALGHRVPAIDLHEADGVARMYSEAPSGQEDV